MNNIAVTNPSVNNNNTAIGEAGASGTIWQSNLTFNGTAGSSSVNGAKTATAANGNILGKNPLLVAPALTAGANFHLQAGSPAIGAGELSEQPVTDLGGAVRPVAGPTDLGVYLYIP